MGDRDIKTGKFLPGNKAYSIIRDNKGRFISKKSLDVKLSHYQQTQIEVDSFLENYGSAC